MTEMYDVIVIGLGPAGASAAGRLARAGCTVLALEKCRLPRHKTCAGGITAKVPPLITCDFSSAVERAVTAAVVMYRYGRPIELKTDDSLGYVVDRKRFDALLSQEAGAAGADIHDGEPARSIEEQAGSITVTTGRASYRCRFVVGADGANGIAAKFLGHARPALGIGLEVQAEDDFPFLREFPGCIGINFGTAPAGYTWVFPRARGASIGIGSPWKRARSLKRSLGECLAVLHLPDSLMEKARAHPLPAFSPFFRKPMGRGAMLLAGDAAGLVDPITGEGIYYALQSGISAAEAIIQAERPSAALRQYRSALNRTMVPDLIAAWVIAHPLYAFPGPSYRALELDSRIRQIYFAVLAGKSRYVRLLAVAPKAFGPMARSLFLRG